MKVKINKNNNSDICVTPVKKYTPPKYPTRDDLKRSPELLKKLPSRWQKNAAVVATAGVVGIMTLTSCGVTNLNSKYQNADISTENIQESDYIIDSGSIRGVSDIDIPTESNVSDDINETGYLDGDKIMEIITESDVPDDITTSKEFTTGMVAGGMGIGIDSEQDYIDDITEEETEETTITTESDEILVTPTTFDEEIYNIMVPGGIGIDIESEQDYIDDITEYPEPAETAEAEYYGTGELAGAPMLELFDNWQ